MLDRYRVERELGRGGQAVVFEALDLELDRLVALKVLTPTRVGTSGDGWEGLLEEARLQAAVEAPGVARLLDARRDGERRYLILELVRGPGLNDVLEVLRDQRLAEGARPQGGGSLARAAGLAEDAPEFRALARMKWDRAVASFGASLARSVARLHERGLIHRDLKPGNIKLDETGLPVVLDFGLARWFGAPESVHLQGTPGYMAPEQLRVAALLDARTDVFQVGLMLYELLSLERAYPADVVRDTPRFIELAGAGRIRPIRQVDSGADVGLAAVITRALAPEPEGRYSDLTQLADDLERVVVGRAPAGAGTPIPHRLRCHVRTVARRPVGAAVLAAAMLVPIVWNVRASLHEQVTSVGGLCFSPSTSTQFDVVSGSTVRVGDDLGIRVTTSTRRTVYVLSVFGGTSAEGRSVSPMRPSPLVEGVPEATGSPLWGLELGPGTHELICTKIVDPNPREGLIVFVTDAPSSLFERWLGQLDQEMGPRGSGVRQRLAFGMLDGSRVPRPPLRGAAFLSGPDAGASAATDQLAQERERYAGLSAAKAAGRDEWDFGEDLIRFEVLCDVVSE